MATESVERALTALDKQLLNEGVARLAERNRHFQRLAEDNGVPPLWARQPGFPTLVKMILEQQVSLESAAAAFRNLERALGEVNPKAFLQLDDAELKTIGFSRQKAGYCRGIAAGMFGGEIDLAGLERMGDEEAHHHLRGIRGIGPWTADVYLLFVLRRPDIWPHGDRALVVSMAENLGLAEVPSYDQAAVFAAAWSPWRAVAARMLWHAYLKDRGRDYGETPEHTG